MGTATRLVEYLVGLEKRYIAVARLGVSTDTDDRTGSPSHVSEGWRDLTDEQVIDALRAQQGERMQVPPAYSAKKVSGQRLYERARRGETVAPPAAPVVIHSISVRRIALPTVEFEVECSSGTYIRSIARDLGDALGVGAHLTELRRTRIGAFDVEGAVPPDALCETESIGHAFREPLAAVAHLPRVDVDVERAKLLRTGRTVSVEGVEGASSVAVAHEGTLLAIAELRDGTLKPRKVFADD
jgi:tRNA pseudouridine55 synthase